MTEVVLGKLEQAFAIDATIEEACFYANINPDTYYTWKKANSELSERMERLRHTPVLTARQTVVTAIKNNPEMALKYLERKRKAEFSTKQENDTTIHVVQPIVGGLAKKQIDEGDDVHTDDDY